MYFCSKLYKNRAKPFLCLIVFYLEHEAYKGNKKQETRRLLASLLYPFIFVTLMWLVYLLSAFFDAEIYRLGIYPKDVSGLKGILFSPFIHGSLSHLASNSLPLLVLGASLFYFYREVAFRVLTGSVLITGLWVWIIARESYHIGASGVVYSLAAFLFVSGILRRHPRLMALSLIVSFLYGGLVWGVFPVKDHISWESHLMGLIAGFVLAVFYRSHGPQRPQYSWELEEAEEEEGGSGPSTERDAEGAEDSEGIPSAGPSTGSPACSEGSARSKERNDCGDPDSNSAAYRVKYVYKSRRSRSR